MATNNIKCVNKVRSKALYNFQVDPQCIKIKENRIYIRVEFRQSLGMSFVSPFQPEREFKVYK